MQYSMYKHIGHLLVCISHDFVQNGVLKWRFGSLSTASYSFQLSWILLIIEIDTKSLCEIIFVWLGSRWKVTIKIQLYSKVKVLNGDQKKSCNIPFSTDNDADFSVIYTWGGGGG